MVRWLHFRRADPQGTTLSSKWGARATIHDLQTPWSTHAVVVARVHLIAFGEDNKPSFATPWATPAEVSLSDRRGNRPSPPIAYLRPRESYIC